MTTNRYDIFARLIRVGDNVAFPMGGKTYTLFTGTVIGFTKKKVRIECHYDWEVSGIVTKFSQQCVVDPAETWSFTNDDIDWSNT